jgi:hypothetical protein
MESTQTTTYRGQSPRKEGLMASITSILTLADLHSDANSSAALCADEAHQWLAEGLEDQARQRALRSLAHSLGVFHPDYQWAAS